MMARMLVRRAKPHLVPLGLATCIALLALVLRPVLAQDDGTTAETGPAVEELRYNLGSAAHGKIDGRCAAEALQLRNEGKFALRALVREGQLHIYSAWWNSSVFAPPVGPPRGLYNKYEVVVEDVDLQPGPLLVGWLPQGQVHFEPPPGKDLSVEFNVTSFFGGPATSVTLPTSDPSHPVVQEYAAPYAFGSGTVRLEGPAVGNLTGVILEGPNVHKRLHPRGTHVTQNDVGGLRTRVDFFQWAVLDIQDALIDLPPTLAGPRCLLFEATIEGTFIAFSADDPIQMDAYPPAAKYKETRLEGRFHIVERLERRSDSEAEMYTQAQPYGSSGPSTPQQHFNTMSVTVERLRSHSQEELAWATLAGAFAWALWKVGAVLFTRLREDNLMEPERRRQILGVIETNPGIPLVDLQTLVGASRSSARYHLRVLQRHDRVRSFKIQGVWRFVPGGPTAAQHRHVLLLEADPKLRSLVEQLRVNPTLRAQDALSGLKTQWGLTESGGWKVIRRALRSGLATKERLGREIVLRPHGTS